MNIPVFAFRNVGRKWQRTIVTTGAMAFAGFMMIFYAGMMDGLLAAMERNAVGMNLGDIQIHAPGYRNDPDLYNRIEKADDLLARLRAEGFHAAARLYGFGLAAAGSSSAGVQLRGIDLKNEATVTQLHRHLLEGVWLDASDSKGVVIGRKLARTLNAGIGSEIVVVSQAADGSVANDLYRVRGILKAVGEGLDRGALLMSDTAFRKLMALPGGVHEIAVLLPDQTLALSSATDRIRKLAPGQEVLSWREIQPVVANILDISKASLIFLLLITYTAIGTVVLNSMLMSVFERIREFGVLKAIGVSPGQVALLIYTEAIIQVAAACLMAVAFGLPVSLYYQHRGIDLSAWMSTGILVGVALDPIWYCRVTVSSVVTPVIYLFAVAAAAVVYPTIKASVISPIKAIYYR
jgi:ABC-type lipoprotein release transport system permease subunit